GATPRASGEEKGGEGHEQEPRCERLARLRRRVRQGQVCGRRDGGLRKVKAVLGKSPPVGVKEQAGPRVRLGIWGRRVAGSPGGGQEADGAGGEFGSSRAEPVEGVRPKHDKVRI